MSVHKNHLAGKKEEARGHHRSFAQWTRVQLISAGKGKIPSLIAKRNKAP